MKKLIQKHYVYVITFLFVILVTGVFSCASTAGEVTPLPATPKGFSATEIGRTHVVLTWQTSEHATSYRLTQDGTVIEESISGTSYRAEQLQPATEYSYTLTACNTEQCSNPTSELPVTTFDVSRLSQFQSWYDSSFYNEIALSREGSEISTPEQLRALADDGANLAGEYFLTRDIDISDESSWVPIGTESAPFTGTLHGNGFVIHWLRIDVARDNQGVFGVVDGATIEHLGVGVAHVSANAKTGGLAGQLNNSTARDIALAGEDDESIIQTTGVAKVEGQKEGAYLGGLAGHVISSALSGHNLGLEVKSAANYVGGLIGRLDEGSFLGSNRANVTGYNNVGGLVGYSAGTVTGTNSGTISGYITVGGIAGVNDVTTIGVNSGLIYGEDCIGGLVGYDKGSVVGANTGLIRGNNRLGGIVGLNSKSAAGYTLGWVILDDASALAGPVIGQNGKDGVPTIADVYYNTGDDAKDRVGSMGGRGIVATNTVGTPIAGSSDATQDNMSALVAGTSYNVNSPSWRFASGSWPALNLPIFVTDILNPSTTDPNRPDNFIE